MRNTSKLGNNLHNSPVLYHFESSRIRETLRMNVPIERSDHLEDHSSREFVAVINRSLREYEELHGEID